MPEHVALGRGAFRRLPREFSARDLIRVKRSPIANVKNLEGVFLVGAIGLAMRGTAKIIHGLFPWQAAGDPSRRWLIFTYSVLGAYRMLRPFVGQKRALQILQGALSRVFKRRVKTYMADRFGISLDAPGEAFERICQNFVVRGEKLYGSRWTYVEAFRDQHRCHVHITKCLFNEICRARSAPELAPLFCALDAVWSEELHKSPYGAHFERPTTLAAGDDACRFQFSRVEH